MYKTGLAVFFSAMAMANAFGADVFLTRNENAIGQLIAGNLLTEIYQKAGYLAHVEPMPAARANAAALSGDKDGEVARIYDYGQRNPSLIRVEPAYYYLTTGVFIKSGKNIQVKTAADLKNYRVGIVRGIAHAELATRGLVGVTVVGNYEQLYQLLDADRIDVAIDEGINAAGIKGRLGLQNLRQIAELARLDLFHMLHPGKKETAHKLSATIKKLKDSGELERMVQRYEKQALEK